MRPVFEIIPEAIFFQQTNLICELSPDAFSYVFENDIERKIHGLSVFHFSEKENILAELKEIFNEQRLLHKGYKKVCISYVGEESTLLPEELYHSGENELLLNSMFGDLNEDIVFTDFIADKQIYNVYRMPIGLHSLIVEQFPLAAISHQYSLLIKQEVVGNKLNVIFYKQSFTVVLSKEGRLQMVNTFPYRSATDVVYHLKNTCRQFKVENASLHIGGMIDLDSDLHKEIKHYFTNISFRQLPTEYEFTTALQNLPAQYFSHLFSLALCV